LWIYPRSMIDPTLGAQKAVAYRLRISRVSLVATRVAAPAALRRTKSDRSHERFAAAAQGFSPKENAETLPPTSRLLGVLIGRTIGKPNKGLPHE